jgi:hypothetical protein
MTTDPGDGFDASSFATEFQQFLNEFRRLIPTDPGGLRGRASEHLGVDPAQLPSLASKFEPTDHPNLQLALDDMSGGEWELIGLPAELRHYHGFSLVGLLGGRMQAPAVGIGPVEYVTAPISADETHPCVQLGVYLAVFEDVPLVVLMALGSEHTMEQALVLEVLAVERATTQRFMAEVRARMDDLNVYRGKVLSFATTRQGRFGINFHRLPHVTRDDIILPIVDVEALERHTVGISERADALRAAGRHLKRGLLLYGPPGTGKTLSVMYLCNLMPERTTLLLAGVGAGALGQASAIARSLQPSMVVLEDVDLIATERTMPGSVNTNPLLFQLLNEMDGMAADADVIFVLTTNRAELLEPALASRPGRIDQVVEVRLPDGDQRRRLFELYLRDVPHRLENMANLVSATEGVSPAFVKEVIRRAIVEATPAGAPETPCVVDEHLNHALADLLTRSDPLTRAILGAGGVPPGESAP